MSHREILESLSGLLLVLFVAMISSTVVSTALPRIVGELNGTQTQYTWVVTATPLAATATGRLADMFSKNSWSVLAALALPKITLRSSVDLPAPAPEPELVEV